MSRAAAMLKKCLLFEGITIPKKSQAPFKNWWFLLDDDKPLFGCPGKLVNG